ncbi:MAG: ribonucleotide reductase subunit alpha [Burkholderiales bacterium]|jgi:hypothetical protein
MIRLTRFDDLLTAARAQPTRQRLLLVFATIGLPDDATDRQRESFAAGRGGALTPVMCVDKAPEELESFEALSQEAAKTGRDWSVVFVAALAGQVDAAPTPAQIDEAMNRVIDSIGHGRMQGLMVFDKAGRPLQLAA